MRPRHEQRDPHSGLKFWEATRNPCSLQPQVLLNFLGGKGGWKTPILRRCSGPRQSLSLLCFSVTAMFFLTLALLLDVSFHSLLCFSVIAMFI